MKLEVIFDRRPADPGLGLILYRGCSHGCRYCNVKRADRPSNMPYDKPTKKASKHLAIERDLQKLTLAGDIRSVFISIQGDPYDMSREDNSFTRQALTTFRDCKYPFHLVTKGGTKAVRDFDLYKPSDKFGCILTFDNPEDSLKWEPRAALPEDRIAALKAAHNLGI